MNPPGIHINPNTDTGDQFGYHFRFEASDGKWYEKCDTSASRCCPNSSSVTNSADVHPFNLPWYTNYTNSAQFQFNGYHYQRKNWN